MATIILNEKEWAESTLKNLTLGTRPSETLGRIARYYYSLGYKKKEIGSLLEDFMLKCDPGINIVKWQPVIDRQVKNVDKYELINIPGITITESEIQRIQELKGRSLQKLMFAIICLAKYSNKINKQNNNWVNRKDRDIFSMANICETIQRQSLMINTLWGLGYVGYSRLVDNLNISVKIIDETSPEVLFINDFRNLGNQYMRYCGEKYMECQNCGLVVKKRSNIQKYCPECARQIHIKRTWEAEKKRRA